MLLIRVLVVGLTLLINNTTLADDVGYSESLPQLNIELIDLINSCPKLALSNPSKFVQPELPGSIAQINGVQYEIRFFSFEDRAGRLDKKITFEEYARQSNLLHLKSKTVEPFNKVYFQAFDYRRAKLGDGVYFSMAIRKIDD